MISSPSSKKKLNKKLEISENDSNKNNANRFYSPKETIQTIFTNQTRQNTERHMNYLSQKNKFDPKFLSRSNLLLDSQRSSLNNNAISSRGMRKSSKNNSYLKKTKTSRKSVDKNLTKQKFGEISKGFTELLQNFLSIYCFSMNFKDGFLEKIKNNKNDIC